MNIIDLFKEQLTGAALGQVSKLIGENENATKSALGAVVPTLLGTMVGKAAQPTGASALLGLLQQGQAQPGGIGDGLSSMLRGLLGGAAAPAAPTAGTSPLSALTSGFGGTILKSLLGDKIGGLADLVGNFSGIKGSSATSLIGMIAPVLLGMIGKQAAAAPGGLSAANLTSYLGSQADVVKAAMPAGFASLPGASDLLKGISPNFGNLLGGLTSAASGIAGAASSAAATGSAAARSAIGNASSAASSAGSAMRTAAAQVEAPKGGFGLKWLLIPILALAAWYFFFRTKGGPEPVTGALSGAVNSAQGAVNNAQGAVKSAADSVSGALGALKFTPGSIGEKVAGALKSGSTEALKLDNVFGGASSTITDAAKAQFGEVGSLLKAVPSLRLGISVYADNDPSKALSEARADSIKATLTRLGITTDRIVASGQGSAKPAGVEFKILK